MSNNSKVTVKQLADTVTGLKKYSDKNKVSAEETVDGAVQGGTPASRSAAGAHCRSLDRLQQWLDGTDAKGNVGCPGNRRP